MSKIPNQLVVIVGIDANAKMRLVQQFDVLGKWYYPAKRTSDDGDRLVNSCEQFDYVLARNIPQSDIRKSRALWDVAFDSDHLPVLLSFEIRDQFKTFLNWQAQSAPELEHVHRLISAVDGELPSTNFNAAFGSPYRAQQLNALSADRVSGEFVSFLDDMSRRTTAAVRTPAKCTTPF
ncbi:hypothetical protein RB195_023489 [Necator americanus]